MRHIHTAYATVYFLYNYLFLRHVWLIFATGRWNVVQIAEQTWDCVFMYIVAAEL
jgi:hypothetical protein